MAVARHTRFPQSKQATKVDEPFTRRVASWTNRFQIAHRAKSNLTTDSSGTMNEWNFVEFPPLNSLLLFQEMVPFGNTSIIKRRLTRQLSKIILSLSMLSLQKHGLGSAYTWNTMHQLIACGFIPTSTVKNLSLVILAMVLL
jgi:hypothetical protein